MRAVIRGSLQLGGRLFSSPSVTCAAGATCMPNAIFQYWGSYARLFGTGLDKNGEEALVHTLGKGQVLGSAAGGKSSLPTAHNVSNEFGYSSDDSWMFVLAKRMVNDAENPDQQIAKLHQFIRLIKESKFKGTGNVDPEKEPPEARKDLSAGIASAPTSHSCSIRDDKEGEGVPPGPTGQEDSRADSTAALEECDEYEDEFEYGVCEECKKEGQKENCEECNECDQDNEDIISGEDMLEGAGSIDEVIKELYKELKWYEEHKKKGWEVTHPVDDDIGYMRRRKKRGDSGRQVRSELFTGVASASTAHSCSLRDGKEGKGVPPGPTAQEDSRADSIAALEECDEYEDEFEYAMCDECKEEGLQIGCDECNECDQEYADEIRGKGMLDGAGSIDEVIGKLHAAIDRYKQLKKKGWEVIEPVSCDYGYMRRRYKRVDMGK